jgi:hypothetical protein
MEHNGSRALESETRKFPNETFEQWEARRAREKGRSDAFWNRPQEQVMADLVIPVEDLPRGHYGGYWRAFRSPNVIDLVALRRQRQRDKSSDGNPPEAA